MSKKALMRIVGVIDNVIMDIRGQRVILDSDLAAVYRFHRTLLSS